MTIITKGMGAIIKKLSVSQKAKASLVKDKLIKKIKSSKHKLYKKKFGKEPTVTIKDLEGKKFKQVDEMIGDKEISRYDKILKAKTWRKR
jgi:hypothetical protein